MAREAADGYVVLPLGLVALTWLRLYLPQSPSNTKGAERLGFAKDEFKVLLDGLLSPLDLRMLRNAKSSWQSTDMSRGP
jgi:hypothetical protein